MALRICGPAIITNAIGRICRSVTIEPSFGMKAPFAGDANRAVRRFHPPEGVIRIGPSEPSPHSDDARPSFVGDAWGVAVTMSQRSSTAERADRGKGTRTEVPRCSHANWEPSPSRDPVALLEEQAKTRVPELVPIRYGRMLVSPFTFFRGAAYLMAADLADGARTGLHAQLCGDAHLSTFGFFAAPDRRLVFSLNDFDETLPGPFEWDLKRLVASFAVAGRDRGFDAKRRRSVNRTVTRAYREAMNCFAEMRTMDLWYARVDVDDVVDRWAAH